MNVNFQTVMLYFRGIENFNYDIKKESLYLIQNIVHLFLGQITLSNASPEKLEELESVLKNIKKLKSINSVSNQKYFENDTLLNDTLLNEIKRRLIQNSQNAFRKSALQRTL